MAIPVGYTQNANGFWYKDDDSSGPYAFDGNSMTLVSGQVGTGSPPDYTQSNNGFWYKTEDNSGPYSYDGTNFYLMTGGGGGGGGVVTVEELRFPIPDSDPPSYLKFFINPSYPEKLSFGSTYPLMEGSSVETSIRIVGSEASSWGGLELTSSTFDEDAREESDASIDFVASQASRFYVITVAELAAISFVAGIRAFVNDCASNTFYDVVTGGGTFIVPVFYDGTDWRVG